MKKRWWIPAAVLVAAALLAWPLRGVVQSGLVVPFARLIWLARGYLGTIPQASFWAIALVISGVIVLAYLPFPDWARSVRRRRAIRAPGALHELAFWLKRLDQGTYPRWHVAHVLAETARDALGVRSRGTAAARQLTGPGWEPPPEVQAYLQAGLTMSHADYVLARHRREPSHQIFEQDLEPVLRYLERYLEVDNERHDR